jgi:hypothetical protein
MQTKLEHHAGGMNKLAPFPFSPTVTVLHISYEGLSYGGDNADNDERAYTKKLSHEDVRENVSYAPPHKPEIFRASWGKSGNICAVVGMGYMCMVDFYNALV